MRKNRSLPSLSNREPLYPGARPAGLPWPGSLGYSEYKEPSVRWNHANVKLANIQAVEEKGTWARDAYNIHRQLNERLERKPPDKIWNNNEVGNKLGFNNRNGFNKEAANGNWDMWRPTNHCAPPWGNSVFPRAAYSSSVRSPVRHSFASYADHVAANFCQQSVLVTRCGAVWAFGRNSDGQLGTGSDRDASRPVQMLVPPAVQAACGADHSLVLTEDGAVWSCGRGSEGQLGVVLPADTDRILRPMCASVATGVCYVACGADHSVVLDACGRGFGCGENSKGQLGLGHRDSPMRHGFAEMQLPRGFLAIDVDCGGTHTLLVADDGRVIGCGGNDKGQLGLGPRKDRLVPEKVSIRSNGACRARRQLPKAVTSAKVESSTLAKDEVQANRLASQLPLQSAFLRLCRSLCEINSLGIRAKPHRHATFSPNPQACNLTTELK
ncbi:unnamed protein product [Polarella glacialis]|uniref:RCC1-like domain-containing protein n=1 Tax=Polarella glacialis TaxID=89957 RepID=A0A813I2B8_POLGL|nr:unnamed protein product [Polarella glacialis]